MLSSLLDSYEQEKTKRNLILFYLILFHFYDQNIAHFRIGYLVEIIIFTVKWLRYPVHIIYTAHKY